MGAAGKRCGVRPHGAISLSVSARSRPAGTRPTRDTAGGGTPSGTPAAGVLARGRADRPAAPRAGRRGPASRSATAQGRSWQENEGRNIAGSRTIFLPPFSCQLYECRNCTAPGPFVSLPKKSWDRLPACQVCAFRDSTFAWTTHLTGWKPSHFRDRLEAYPTPVRASTSAGTLCFRGADWSQPHNDSLFLFALSLIRAAPSARRP